MRLLSCTISFQVWISLAAKQILTIVLSGTKVTVPLKRPFDSHNRDSPGTVIFEMTYPSLISPLENSQVHHVEAMNHSVARSLAAVYRKMRSKEKEVQQPASNWIVRLCYNPAIRFVADRPLAGTGESLCEIHSAIYQY